MLNCYTWRGVSSDVEIAALVDNVDNPLVQCQVCSVAQAADCLAAAGHSTLNCVQTGGTLNASMHSF